MKNWANSNDQVNVVDRRNRPSIRAFSTNVNNINAENYLYSVRGENGENDASLEKQIYAPLDSEAKSLTEEILFVLSNGELPRLNKFARELLWQFYMYNAFKRHPKSLLPYVDQMDLDELREEFIANEIADGQDPTETRKLVERIDLREILKTTGIQYARGEQNDEVLELFGRMGIVFAMATEGTSFVLPDRSFEIMNGNVRVHPIWIPISPKYAIRQYLNDGVSRRLLMGKADVRRLNERWYGYSDSVIGVSKIQLASLAKNHDRQKLDFN